MQTEDTESTTEVVEQATDELTEGESFDDVDTDDDDTTNDEDGDEGAEQDDQPRHTVKLNGEDVEVTLDELLKGYSRHDDYTRKTQAVAKEREELAELVRLKQWLTEDPAGTLQALQKAYGIGAAEEDDLDDLDPIERRLRESERFIQDQQETARQTAIINEASAALKHHGLTDEDPTELLQFAMDGRIGDLKVAARLLKVERAEAAQAAAAVAKTSSTKRVVDKKRAAAVVGGGRNTPSGTTVAAKPKFLSLKEAWDAASTPQ